VCERERERAICNFSRAGYSAEWNAGLHRAWSEREIEKKITYSELEFGPAFPNKNFLPSLLPLES